MTTLRWPLPALLAWGLAGVLQVIVGRWAGQDWALAVSCAVPAVLALVVRGWWRRLLMTAGFPLALTVSGSAVVPGWAWLVLLVVLLLLYPLGAWRDAPVFPTPRGALKALAAQAPLPALGARLLDAGCGLGDGLIALHQAYPNAALTGLERSLPLGLLCKLRCPWARIQRGDMWRADWSGYAMVYLFQRPESMARAWQKACAEMAPGSWLVSLEFPVPAAIATPLANAAAPEGRAVWVYRVPKR